MTDPAKVNRRSAPKAKVSPARNIIALVLLAGLVTVAVLEVLAVRNHAAAVEKLTKALDNEEIGPTQIEVEKLIGNTPQGKPVLEGQELKVRYAWRGVFREHAIAAVYLTTESVPRLYKFE